MTAAGRKSPVGFPIDLRSDFVAPPTAAMLAALTAAAGAPMGFGLRDDDAQVALEARAAVILGKEDALLFPTCTMANLAAVMLQVSRGQYLIADADAHIATSEGGGAAAIAGAMLKALPGTDGVIPLDALERELALQPDAQRPSVGLVVLEDTHNRSGGMPLPIGHADEVGTLVRRFGAALHVDGARLFNSSVATGRDPAALVDAATTVSISLNKGLGAPNGAILAGRRTLIARAVSLRQQLGGGLRPAGMLAAAGLEALNRIAELGRDHALAKRIAEALHVVGGCAVDLGRVRTNIVMVHFAPAEFATATILEALAARGVLAIAMAPGRLRLCVHRGVPDDAPERIAAAFHTALGASRHDLSQQENTHV